jgi:mannose-6-phosphate isomerase-like protein (cupin superfamily)
MNEVLAGMLVIGLGLAGIAASAAGPATGTTETYLSAKDLAAKLVGAGSAGNYQIPSGEGYKVLMIERKATGDAEVHTQMNDIIVIQHGHGEFLVGGSIKGNHEIAPTEWRGGDISGGHRYPVSVGDLLMIPAGIPHKAFVTDGPFTYLAIKTEAVKGR